jgi:hypothetical protein
MARTIAEIKKEMTDKFIENGAVKDLYGFDGNITFEDQFSRVSIENILFYTVAVGQWVIEQLFDTHKREVNEIIENITPHRPKWYRDKALKFMKDETLKGKTLIDETDVYDTTGMSDADIKAAQIVKYATAVELNGLLVVKIATGESGNLTPIPEEYETAFKAYMNEIRDAGVRVSVVNQIGDRFACELTIYYDSILLESKVEGMVLDAIKTYITGLPFNGEYSNMALVDAVQVVDGVNVVSFVSSASGCDEYLTPINAKTVPEAGYFTFNKEKITLTMKPYAVGQQLQSEF